MELKSITKVFFFFFSLIFISCDAFECGRRKKETALVSGGNQTIPGEWPWVASLHKSSYGNYFCGSTLVSEKLLVTGKKKIKLKQQKVNRFY
jgi:hypothetical protein